MLKRLYYYAKFLKSLFQTNVRLIWGMWRLLKLPQPSITVFGSARLDVDSPYAKKACALSKKLSIGGFSIITGGGGGIMEAANRGAFEAAQELGIKYKKSKRIPKRTLGIGLTRLNQERPNKYVQDNIVLEHFFARKWLLVRYSIGFVVFPGGFGTMDELFELMVLVQCERMKKVPIILFGKNFWEPLGREMISKMLKRGLINKSDRNIIFAITDDVDEAYKIISKYCKRSESKKRD